jgi:hypothetical protein
MKMIESNNRIPIIDRSILLDRVIVITCLGFLTSVCARH